MRESYTLHDLILHRSNNGWLLLGSTFGRPEWSLECGWHVCVCVCMRILFTEFVTYVPEKCRITEATRCENFMPRARAVRYKR